MDDRTWAELWERFCADESIDAVLREAERRDPEDPDTRVLRGDVAAAEGRDLLESGDDAGGRACLEESNERYREAIARAPRWARRDQDSIYLRLAINLLLLQRPVEARAALEEGLAALPGEHAALELLARLLIDGGEPEAAVERLAASVDALAASADPELDEEVERDGEVLTGRREHLSLQHELWGDALLALGQEQDAAARYRAAQEHWPRPEVDDKLQGLEVT